MTEPKWHMAPLSLFGDGLDWPCRCGDGRHELTDRASLATLNDYEQRISDLETRAALADSLLKPNYYMPRDILSAWEQHKEAYDALPSTTKETQ